MSNNFSRGSEWRRWDLHIHTPETVKNDQYKGTTINEKWENFYNDINRYIDPNNSVKNIAVIGITDYLSIGNYKKVIASNKIPSSVNLIMPNVELRICPISSDSPVNIHILFNPDIISQVESRFFSRLKFDYASTSFNATKPDLIRLGKTMNENLDDFSAYIMGIENFVVPFSNLKNVFDKDKDLRDNVIIGVSNSSHDGASGITCHSDYFSNDRSQLMATRQSIYQFVDVIFSANPKDIEYFLGRKENCPIEKVIKECGSLKPCIHGSDANSNEKIFEPNNKRYCWIKADPTFNGLKQIKYEPEERVRICESLPNSKPDYFVIDRVEYNDSSFQSDPIYFNDKLTCIIGGKSTGKSILIQNLAMKIDPEEAEKCLEKSKNKTLQVSNISVFWKDGSEEKRKIVYIPQTYLNKLSDEEQEKTEIDTWIHNIMLDKQEIHSAQETFNTNINSYKVALEKLIIDLFKKLEDCNDLQLKLSNIDTQLGIKNEIKKLETEKALISKEINLSEEDLTNYNTLVDETQSLEQNKRKLEYTKIKIAEIGSLITKKELNFDIQNEYFDIVINKQNEITNNADNLWIEQQKIILEIIDKKIETIANDLNNNKNSIKLLEEKIKNNNILIELTQKIQLEKNKLKDFIEKESILKIKEEECNAILSQMVDSINFYKNEHEKFASIVNQNNVIDDGLEFYVDVPFRKDAFVEKLLALYHNRNLTFKTLVDPDQFTENEYNNEMITNLIKETIKNPNMLKGGNTPEIAIKGILSDWYNTLYKVKMDGDSIDKMSPGKKALVLLKILISLAETKCPILIDQPEDDLDNRSIFDDLVNYIKTKKKDRQIIIVTHNANLVLGCDADEIIIANQDGTTSPNKQYKFEYRSGAIENNVPVFKSNGEIETGILNSQGIQQHICDILEGGEIAFAKRKNKYNM